MKLHDYQKEAIKFGLKNRAIYYAIDLGLGKTAIDLHRIRIMKNHGIKSIVFAPIPVIYSTWPEEIQKWGLHLSYAILHGLRKSYILQKEDPDIFLANYEGLKWFREAMANYRPRWKPRSLVLDEGSMIKSPSTVRFKTLKKLNPLWHERRSVLSATPAPNGYHNLWTQYYMLDQGERLGKAYYKFRNRFFHYTGPPLYKTILIPGMDKEIQKRIFPITFRLEAKESDRPELINNNIPLILSDKLMAMYSKLEKDFFLEFEASEATALNAAALSMKLRQFIQGAIYTDGGGYQLIHSLKLDALKSLVEVLDGRPLLCAIQFRFELEMINKAFKKEIPYIAKGVSQKRVQYLKNEWNKGTLPLLLCHPASISHGVNMQKSGNNLLWYAQTWNLEHYLQLIGRLRRQGAVYGKVVNNTFMVKNTVDERIAKALQRKGAVQKDLLDALLNISF